MDHGFFLKHIVAYEWQFKRDSRGVETTIEGMIL